MDNIIWYPGHELLPDTVESGANCTIRTSAGRAYTDLEAGVWCLVLGHAHPRIVSTIAGQAARIAHTGFSYTSAVVDDCAVSLRGIAEMGGGRTALSVIQGEFEARG